MMDHREKLETKLARLADAAARIAGKLDVNSALEDKIVDRGTKIARLEVDIRHDIIDRGAILEGIALQRKNRANREEIRSLHELVCADLEVLRQRLGRNRSARRRLNHELEALDRQGVLPL